jgi:superfamily II DNA or RNA helicase
MEPVASEPSVPSQPAGAPPAHQNGKKRKAVEKGGTKKKRNLDGAEKKASKRKSRKESANIAPKAETYADDEDTASMIRPFGTWMLAMIQASSVAMYWYQVKKECTDPEKIRKAKSDLMIQSTKRDYMTKNKIPPVCMYYEDADWLYVPTYYGFLHFGPPQYDLRGFGSPIGCKFDTKYALKPELDQVAAVDAVMRELQKPVGRAFLCAPPGGGKTVMGIYAIGALGRKAIVVVHKEFLLAQWIERINQYMPGAKIGFVKDGTVELGDYDIVVVMVQSLLNIAERSGGDPSDPKTQKAIAQLRVLDQCGTVIFDEARHYSARMFCKALAILNKRFVLALDGTPDKHPFLGVMANAVGPVTFRSEKRYFAPVRVRMLVPDYEPVKEVYMGNGELNKSRMLTTLTEIDRRTNYLVDAVIAEATLPHRPRFLVLSDRVQHLEKAIARIREKAPDVTCGHFKAGISKSPALMEEVHSKQIIFATFSMAGEAFDNPNLVRLLYLTGTANPTQSCMRIMRGTSSEDKIIFDSWDYYSFWTVQIDCRLRFYFKEGYEVVCPVREMAEYIKPKDGVVREVNGEFVVCVPHAVARRQVALAHKQTPDDEEDFEDASPQNKRKAEDSSETPSKRPRKCPF